MADWPTKVKIAMVTPQKKANREAAKLEAAGNPAGGLELRVFGRLNGIEAALLALSEQIAEHDASRR
jgi:hypothetical protein